MSGYGAILPLLRVLIVLVALVVLLSPRTMLWLARMAGRLTGRVLRSGGHSRADLSGRVIEAPPEQGPSLPPPAATESTRSKAFPGVWAVGLLVALVIAMLLWWLLHPR